MTLNSHSPKIEIWCTSASGAIQDHTSVSWDREAGAADFDVAMKEFGRQVDMAEENAFLGVLNTARRRVSGNLTESCASHIGGSNVAEVQAKLLTISIGLFDAGPLSVTTTDSGAVVGYNSQAAVYNYPYLDITRGSINFNRGLNWSNPAMSWAVNQNGVETQANPTLGYMAQVGASSMSSEQFVDLILLHELRHSYGNFHGTDETKYKRDIWTRCF